MLRNSKIQIFFLLAIFSFTSYPSTALTKSIQNTTIDGSEVSLKFQSKLSVPKNCANWKYTFTNNGDRKLSVFVMIETLGGEEINRNGSVGIDQGITQTDSIRVCDYQFPKRKKGRTYSMNLNLRVAEYDGANNIYSKKIKALYK